MNEKANIVWMNVTTSINWQRPPVGIVRVEQSLCDELRNIYGANLKLCIWENGAFVEYIEPISTQKKEKSAQKDLKVEAVSLPYIYPLVSKREALKAIIQAILSLMPNKIKPLCNKFLYRLRSYVKRNRNFPKTKNKNLGDSTQKNEDSRGQINHPFSPGDTLLSVGLDWQYQFYKTFYFLRKDFDIKIVTCCYDLIPVIYPQYCVSDVASIFTSYFNEIVDGSSLILCISKQTEKDLREMLLNIGGGVANTKVIALGDNVPCNSSENISKTVYETINSDFILYVSTIERRKNHEVLYRAYHLLCKEGMKEEMPTLVFVGMPGWGVDELLKDMELDPAVKGKIVRFDHVNDKELSKLIESSMFCVYPSLYEGWGLPVAEALSMGKVVLSSNRGSLPEVGGGFVRYLDPWNTREWANEMLRMVRDHQLRTEIENNVRLHYSVRRWRDTAIDVKKAIQSLQEG